MNSSSLNDQTAVNLIRWTVVRLYVDTTHTDFVCGWDTARSCGWASDLAATSVAGGHELQTGSGQVCRLLGRPIQDPEASQALRRRLALLSAGPDFSDVSSEYESIAVPCILA